MDYVSDCRKRQAGKAAAQISSVSQAIRTQPGHPFAWAGIGIIFLLHGGINGNHQPWQEPIMARYSIDCRDHPGDIKCTLALSADTKEELQEAAMQHGVHVHGFEDTPELRNNLLEDFKEETLAEA